MGNIQIMITHKCCSQVEEEYEQDDETITDKMTETSMENEKLLVKQIPCNTPSPTESFTTVFCK